MVVDDSLTARNVFLRLFESDPDFAIVAQASRAERALDMLASVETDVLLLDLEMPGMGGLAALPQLIEAARGAKILIVSALTKDGAEQTLKALSLGAADTIAKPTTGLLDPAFQEEVRAKVRALAHRRTRRLTIRQVPAVPQRSVIMDAPVSSTVLAIGGSTGGIHALCQLLRHLPARCGMPILVTQHLPCEFMDVFARQLAEASGREAVVAQSGLALVADRIVIAPGNAHLVVKQHAGRLIADLRGGRSDSGCLPSVDVMLASLADKVGGAVTAVVLSGMGKDGLIGARKLAAAGGTIIAQDEESSAVWGMPRAVVEEGLTLAALPPAQLASFIAARLGAMA
jgi:two-component system, chemotaxis family, protein-glutamate methylesterase/glutaminase